MIKHLFILINTLGFFVYGLFSGDNGVKISHNIPQEIIAGAETEVEIVITKGELSGAAWFSLDVPAGTVIKPKETNGVKYLQEENAATWTWDSLPKEESFSFKFILVLPDSLQGARELKGRFGYIDNNEKQLTEMDVASFTVSPASKTNPPTPESAPKSADSTTISPPSMAEPPGEIVVRRSIKQADNKKDFVVEINIKKGNTKGFARYSDDAHANVTAKAIKTDGASFSIADGKIKFVWVNVPAKEELSISYLLSAKAGKQIIMNGEYSYLEDSQSKKEELKADTLSFGKESGDKPVVSVPKEPETPSNPPKEENQPLEKRDCKADFVVQVGAFTNAGVTVDRMKRIFRIKESVRSEMQGGFTKFLVGKHEEYKKARDHRNSLKSVNGVRSAFVAAYNEGNRITVQEALMMCNQRWFP